MANNASEPKYVATLVDSSDGEKYYVLPDNTTAWNRPANNQGYTFLPEGWFTVDRNGVTKFKKQGTTEIRNTAPTNNANTGNNDKGHAYGVLLDQISDLENAIKNVTKKANSLSANAAGVANGTAANEGAAEEEVPAEGGRRRRGRKTRSRKTRSTRSKKAARRAHSRRRR